MSTAIVIDGAFFLRRFHFTFPDLDARDAETLAVGVTALAAYHSAAGLGWPPVGAARSAVQTPGEISELYRIFFYDCPPLTKRVRYPVSQKALNLQFTDAAILRLKIHEALRATRKVALRLGRLNESLSGGWRAKPDAVRRWLAAPADFAPVDDDFEIDVMQKGVDMRLGLDVAAMAFKKQVQRIVLVAADADFVPAVKLARREGIDVVLDPMGANAAGDLLEHVDGIRTAKIDRLFDGPCV